MQDRIESRLHSALKPERLSLVNESHQHNVPKGSETHWNLIVVSSIFAGKSRIERHRLVHDALAAEQKAGIHALTMKTLTPKEWEDAGGEVANPAPLCLGGSSKS
jgi:BolA protein